MLDWNDDDYQGKREDQVSFAEVVAGICLGLLAIAVIGAALLHYAGTAP